MRSTVHLKIKNRQKKRKFSLLSRIKFPRLSKKILVVLPLFIVFLVVWSVPRLLIIGTVSCESQFGPCSNALDTQLKQLENKNYAFISSRITGLLTKDFFVEKYTLKLDLPSRLKIYAVEKKAEVAFVKSSNTSEFYLADTSGIVINKQDKSSLPIIVMSHDYNFEVGKRLPDDLIFAAKLMRECFKVYNSKLAFVSPEGFEIELRDSPKVVFPLSGDMDVLFGSLSLMLSRLNTEAQDLRIEEVLGKKTSIIDLRFKNPILK